MLFWTHSPVAAADRWSVSLSDVWLRFPTPAVREAFERGQIGARRADEWLYLDPVEQEGRLSALLSERGNKARAYQTAAGVIDAYPQRTSRSRSDDLQELGRRIRAALTGGVHEGAPQ